MAILKEVYFVFALVTLDMLFTSSFLSIKSKYTKLNVIGILIFLAVFWSCIIFFRLIVENIFSIESNLIYVASKNFIRTISISISIMFLFSGARRIKVIIIILNVALHSIVEVVEQVLFSLFSSHDNFTSFVSKGQTFFGAFLIEFVIIIYFKIYRKKGVNLSPRILILYIILSLLSFGSFFIQAIRLVVVGEYDTLTDKDIFLTICSGVLLVLFYVMFELTNIVQTKNQTYQLQNQRYYYLEEYYRNIELYQNEVRKIKHDMNNQLVSIKGQLYHRNTKAVKNQIKEFKNKLE